MKNSIRKGIRNIAILLLTATLWVINSCNDGGEYSENNKTVQNK